MPDLLDWSALIDAGQWQQLVTDAMRSGDPGLVADAAALVEAVAPVEQRALLLHRMRQVWRGQWDTMIREAAAVDPRDVDSLRRGVADLDHVADLVRVAAPVEQQEGLLRRVKLAATTARKALDREMAKTAPDADAVTKPGPARPVAPVRRSPAPVRDEAAEVEGTAGSTAGESAAPGSVEAEDSEVEPDRWAAALAAAVKKGAKDRAALGLAPIVLDEAKTTAALDEFHAAFVVRGKHLRWVRTPAWTGYRLAKWLCAAHGSMVEPVPARPDSVVWEIGRRGKLLRIISFLDTEAPLPEGHAIVEIDVNAQHLAAFGLAMMGDGEPTHRLDADEVAAWGELADLVTRPGYVVLDEAPDLSQCPPHVRAAFARVDVGWTLPTPLAAYLVRDHNVALQVGEAIIWDTREVYDETRGRMVPVKAYGKRLRKWCEVVTQARARLIERGQGHPDDHPARLALLPSKGIYAAFTGGFLRSKTHNVDPWTGKPTPWLLPGHYDQGTAMGSANMLRAMDKAYAHGHRAIGAIKDAALYAMPVPADGADDPGVPAGMERSDKPGKWKVNRWAVITDAIRARAHGKRAVLDLLRKEVKAAHVARERAKNAPATTAQGGAA